MYEVIELSRNACAFMMRSMFADHPYSDVVSTQGESAIRLLTMTFSTLSPKTSFMSLVNGSISSFRLRLQYPNLPLWWTSTSCHQILSIAALHTRQLDQPYTTPPNLSCANSPRMEMTTQRQ